jgi:16S rRNA (cytosine967-C5)-methyltransferase
MWTPDELVNFVARVLYEVLTHGLTLDYAFQRVARGWRRLKSFKVFYDVAFDVVRNYFLLRHLAARLFGSEGAKAVVRAWFVYRAEQYFRNKQIVARYRKRLLKRALMTPEDALKSVEELRRDTITYLSIKYSYHPAIVKTLVENLGAEEAERVMEAGNQTWMWLRINTLKADVDKALRLLEREADVEPHPRLSFMVLLKSARKPVQYLTAVRELVAVPQDLASVYAVLALEPSPGDKIADLAAAPGMKTSLIVQLTEGRARVVAADVSAARVARMRGLLKRLGASDSVEIIRADSRKLATRRFDKALVDAPCTSSGAFTKEPAVKVYPRVSRARHYGALQRELLANALRLAERVTYSVCSILPEEGEDVIAGIDAAAERAPAELVPAYRGPGGRTLPHVHRSEAFFIARLARL